MATGEQRGRAKQDATIERIVVVGGGDCGTRAAIELRTGGFEGSITLIGEEAVAPYERPALSKDVLVDDAATPRAIADAGRLDELAVVWRSGVRAVRIDPEQRGVVLADDTVVRYDRLLLATGARARRPALPGPDLVRSVRTFDDVRSLRARLGAGTRLLIIGGGFVGLEVAASAVARGCSVTVVEFAHRLMSRVVPAPVAQVIHDRHLAEGVDLRCGVGVGRVEQRGDGVRAMFTDGTHVDADVVIAGIGAIPNTELAATAGLVIANGIAVDEHLRTSDRAIFAAGDCCSVPHPLYGGARIRLEAWRNALTHAELAARNLLGADEVFDSVPWFWSDQYDLGLQIAGLHAAATQDVARRRADGSELRFGLDPTGRVVSASGVAIGTAIARDIRLAEQLITARATPRPTDLSDASVDLRSLVPAA